LFLSPSTVSSAKDIHDLVIVAARAADDKKGDDVLILDVGETLTITDAFLITSAPNTRLVATIADSIEAAVKAAGGPGPIATEGLDEASWVLLDFGGFVVHVFLEETRRYYDLERLWADAPKIEWRILGEPIRQSLASSTLAPDGLAPDGLASEATRP
jgi:ribosome-associated protein